MLSVRGKVRRTWQGKLFAAGPRRVVGAEKILYKPQPGRAVTGGNPPLASGYRSNVPFGVYERIMVTNMSDSSGSWPRWQRLLVPPPSEVSPSEDMEGWLKDCSSYMTPKLPLHLEHM